MKETGHDANKNIPCSWIRRILSECPYFPK
jgi:hypothetical protein